MSKKGFTLMELLVSIFITGMVMLSLVAMWKTSSNQTAQAQRQAIIRNENTIFLRRFYTDFISASEILCPWAYDQIMHNVTEACKEDVYVAVNEMSLKKQPEGSSYEYLLTRTTGPVCGAGNNEWGTSNIDSNIAERCIMPKYVVYKIINHNVYRCENNYFTGNDYTSAPIQTVINDANSYCDFENHPERLELIMPYIGNFKLEVSKNENESVHTMNPELLLHYTVNREFGEGVPPVSFKFKRLLTKKRGV